MSIEAMKQALDLLETCWGCGDQDTLDYWNETAQALRQAIDQAEKQEPVIGTKTWLEDGKMVTQHLYASDINQERVDETAKCKHGFECPRCGHCCQHREWVGLTHEERDEIDQNCRSQMEALFAVEAKLKEKNCSAVNNS